MGSSRYFKSQTFIFYLHYLLISSGVCGCSILLGVYLKEYSDASQGEIGMLLMTFPLVSIIVKPLFCSMADRRAAHKQFLLSGLAVMHLSYVPFIVLPFFPSFYLNHLRLSWWLLAFFSEIGSAALGLVWCLGDCLTVNAAAKSGTATFGQIRLVGTVSWGVYGFFIGQINETPSLPKYVPVFIVLLLSTLIEIILVLIWDDEAFVVRTAGFNEEQASNEAKTLEGIKSPTMASLAGSLRLDKQAGRALRDLISADDLENRLKNLSEESVRRGQSGSIALRRQVFDLAHNEAVMDSQVSASDEVANKKMEQNLQTTLFKMIFNEDRRLVKYLVFFTLFGLLASPFQFVFMSLEEVCKERGYNFSQLFGYVILSQAGIEALAFFAVPYIVKRIGQTSVLVLALMITNTRSLVYSTIFYTPGVSPYWSALLEWGHGIPWAMTCTLSNDIALIFANQSELFIPRLRKLGIISDPAVVGIAKSKAEEESIKVALRATMTAVFGGAMDGLGASLGAALCGFIYDYFGYVNLWRATAAIGLVTMLVHVMVELSNTRYSDRYWKSKRNVLEIVEPSERNLASL